MLYLVDKCFNIVTTNKRTWNRNIQNPNNGFTTKWVYGGTKNLEDSKDIYYLNKDNNTNRSKAGLVISEARFPNAKGEGTPRVVMHEVQASGGKGQGKGAGAELIQGALKDYYGNKNSGIYKDEKVRLNADNKNLYKYYRKQGFRRTARQFVDDVLHPDNNWNEMVLTNKKLRELKRNK